MYVITLYIVHKKKEEGIEKVKISNEMALNMEKNSQSLMIRFCKTNLWKNCTELQANN
jgi:hypothetical protein